MEKKIMAINLKKTVEKDINNIKGLRLGVANAGIKDGTSDLLVISLIFNEFILTQSASSLSL